MAALHSSAPAPNPASTPAEPAPEAWSSVAAKVRQLVANAEGLQWRLLVNGPLAPGPSGPAAGRGAAVLWAAALVATGLVRCSDELKSTADPKLAAAERRSTLGEHMGWGPGVRVGRVGGAAVGAALVVGSEGPAEPKPVTPSERLLRACRADGGLSGYYMQ